MPSPKRIGKIEFGLLSPKEIRTLVITLGASLLWLTDALHHWNPALPAILAWGCLMMPGIGVLTWQDFEKNFGWANFFVMASSLSLARAWIADILVRSAPVFSREPLLVPVLLLLVAAPLRLLIPNIAGFLATTIPIAMAIGATTGVNPAVCGLAAMIAGDAVLYYPAQSASSPCPTGRQSASLCGSPPAGEDNASLRRGVGAARLEKGCLNPAVALPLMTGGATGRPSG